MTTLEKRLATFAARTDVTASNLEFAKSLLSNCKKWNGLTPKQETAFTRMEARYSPEAKLQRDNWEANYTSEMREKARIMAHYYQANPPYFGDLATRILTEEGYVPSEKAYRKMCENKYASKVFKAHNAEPKFQPGSLVVVRSNARASRTLKNKPCLVIKADLPIRSAANGSKLYSVLPFGEAVPTQIEERWLKKHRG